MGLPWVCNCSLEELTQAFTPFLLTAPPIQTVSCSAWLRIESTATGGAEVLSCSGGVLDSVVGSQLRGMGSSLGRYDFQTISGWNNPTFPCHRFKITFISSIGLYLYFQFEIIFRWYHYIYGCHILLGWNNTGRALDCRGRLEVENCHERGSGGKVKEGLVQTVLSPFSTSGISHNENLHFHIKYHIVTRPFIPGHSFSANNSLLPFNIKC